MKRSISNLAWLNSPVNKIAPILRDAGLQGVELAPTAIWDDVFSIATKDIVEYAKEWSTYGLEVSGVQSLLYGHPELQIFDRSTWPALLKHMKSMIRITESLSSRVAVFGSPRNRQRGAIDLETANQWFAEFITELIPILSSSQVTLTLEPNAPAYGADFLTTYAETVAMCDRISSVWVQPQVDTGCLYMVGENSALAIRSRVPRHVHVSVPNLLPPPGPIEHKNLQAALIESSYAGWIVLEMLPVQPEPWLAAAAAAEWLTATYPNRGLKQ